MGKSPKSGVFVIFFLVILFATYPAQSEAAGAGAEISLRLHGGFSYLKAKDVNTGLGGFFEYYTLLGELRDATIEGGYGALHDGYDFGADLIFQISPTIGIGVGAGYLKSVEESSLAVTYLGQTSTLTVRGLLSAMPVRLGVFLTLPISDRMNFTANAGAAWYASLKFRSDLRLVEGSSWIEDSEDAKRNSFGDIGFQGGLGFEYMFTPKLGFFLDALGRYARFKNYDSVTKVFEQSGGFSDTIQGKLYLRNNIYPDGTYTWFTVEETEPVPDEDTTYREPRFDFSGFCLQAGFRIRF